MTLNELKLGEKGVVEEITTNGSMRRRLQDIGIISGTELECVGRSPGGDPAAYFIKGAVIALRDEDSRGVCLRAGGLEAEHE